MRFRPRRALTLLAAAGLMAGVTAAGGLGGAATAGAQHNAGGPPTTTPIKHLVVIFDENVSFDHYFGTYPVAANQPGEPSFTAAKNTPETIGLNNTLLTHNPNLSNPTRLGHSDPMTCDQDHGYTSEQSAFDGGAMDKFVQSTGHNVTVAQCLASFGEPVPAGTSNNSAVMSYYDGNTVTGLWNYAQHFAMNDQSFGTTFGPSTPGALNVTAGNTYGAICQPSSFVGGAPTCPTVSDPTTVTADPGVTQPVGPGTVTGDADPYYDVCSYLHDGNTGPGTIQMGGNNIGDLLNSKNITWGWFEGGFDAGYVPGHGTPPTASQFCSASHQNLAGNSVTDFSPHHEPFQYYASTANPQHLPPTSVSMIGHQDQANHQYDTADFWAAADAGNMPSVSYLKAPAYQDGHGGYSDPLDEQTWLVDTINHLQSLKSWSSTAVIVSYDDSDGWYDHVMSPIVNQSQTSSDTLTGAGACGSNTAAIPVSDAGQVEQGRCGYGPRLPFLVISPFAKTNYVSHSVTDQSSVVSFIQQNWGLGQIGNASAADTEAGSILPMLDFSHHAKPLYLDASSGEPVPASAAKVNATP